MDPNNKRMQMWMKTTRGTPTPRNEQCVSFKTHSANTGPKRSDLPRATKNKFPGACLRCTLMKPERRESTPPPPRQFSPRNVKTENALDDRDSRRGGNSLEKGGNEFFAAANFHQTISTSLSGERGAKAGEAARPVETREECV